MKSRLIVVLLGSWLAACSTPKVAVVEPTSARPAVSRAEPLQPTGSIYSAVSYRPVFEDRRARAVGDVVIINISENIKASQEKNTNASRSSSVVATTPTFNMGGMPFGGLLAGPGGFSVNAKDDNKLDGKGKTSNVNQFTGNITATVIEVLPNGNLMIAGEKQVGINHQVETLKISGVISPVNIINGNQVSSTQIADARISYKGEGFMDEANNMGWLARFFLSVLPF